MLIISPTGTQNPFQQKSYRQSKIMEDNFLQFDPTEYTIIESIPVTPLVFPNNTSEQGKLPYEIDIREVIRNNVVFKVHSLVYTCSTCDRKFNNTGNFEKHIVTHKGRHLPYMCDACDKEFTSYRKYLLHRRSHSTVCSECQITFENTTELEKHREKAHKNIRPFRCETCGKGFLAAKTLKQHQNTHKAAAFSCEFCSKTYKRNEDLLRHYESH